MWKWAAFLLTTNTIIAMQEPPHNFAFKPLFVNTREDSVYSDRIGAQVYSVPYTGGEIEYTHLKPHNIYVDANLGFLISNNKARGMKTTDFIDEVSSRKIRGQLSLGYAFGTLSAFIAPFGGLGFQGRIDVEKRAVKKRDENGVEQIVDWNVDKISRKPQFFPEIGVRTRIHFQNGHYRDGAYIEALASLFIFPKEFDQKQGWGYQITLPIGFSQAGYFFAFAPLVRAEFEKQNNAFKASFLDVGGSIDLGLRY